MSEADEVKRRFARRSVTLPVDRYSALQPEVLLWMQERERALVRLLRSHAPGALRDLKVLEIGCGSGGNLLELIRLGFDPANLIGNELLPERAAAARVRLPQGSRVIEGDALTLPIDAASIDIVYQSTVFTSLLDAQFRVALAQRMWNWVRPGGCVLWYDFVYDNPANADVRGVSLKSVRQLFPDGEMTFRRVTLAPPISRPVSRIHPLVYHLLNSIPWLRSHLLCWIRKPNGD